MNLQQQLAYQNIEDARQSIKRVYQKIHGEADESKLVLERLYNSITVVAGGTLALSVTYLGYLKASTPVHLWMMKTSWALLLTCMATSLFYQDLTVGTRTMRGFENIARNGQYTGSSALPRKTR